MVTDHSYVNVNVPVALIAGRTIAVISTGHQYIPVLGETVGAKSTFIQSLSAPEAVMVVYVGLFHSPTVKFLTREFLRSTMAV